MISKTVYDPQEDSMQLSSAVVKYSYGDVLDLGCGSGIQGITAMKNKSVESVTFSDINPQAIICAKKNLLKIINNPDNEKNISKNLHFIENKRQEELIKNFYKSKKTDFIVSDLFLKIEKKYDTIIFNPPYLPEDKYDDEKLITTGGKNGYEIILEFLKESKNHLKKNGIILLLISSLSNKKIIDDYIKLIGLKKYQISKQSLFMEQLYVYLIKSEIKNTFKGHRGEVLSDVIILNNKEIRVAIKTSISKNYDPKTEAKYLVELNKYSIGPKLISYSDNSLTMEFIEGDRIIDFFKKSSKNQKLEVIKKILIQCKKMDELQINKYEMTNPYKHIIVQSSSEGLNPIMIDFERCSKSIKTKNITQFVQFLISSRIVSIFKNSNEPIFIDSKKLMSLSKNYKNEMISDKKNRTENYSIVDQVMDCLK